MRIAIACMGSRGDISPLLAVARIFADRGDAVKIGCTVESQEYVRSYGFEPHVLTTLNLKEFLQSPQGQKKFFGASTTTQLREVGKLADLVTLPGVGRKTANVVLGNAFGVPGITVDTHFGRLARRFGDLGPAVADVDAPQAGHALEIGSAVAVVDPHAVAALDDERPRLAKGLQVGVGMDQGFDVAGREVREHSFA